VSESETSSTASADDIGAKLKARRKQLGISIRTLSSISGVSTGMISLIERNRVEPSLRVLKELARCLEVSIADLFQSVSRIADVPSEDGDIVVRKGRGRKLSLSSTGVTKTVASPPTVPLELIEMVVKPGGGSGNGAYSHSGDEAGYIVSGQLLLEVDSKKFLLNAGDSFAFSSERPHRFENRGKTDVVILWIVTPPYWSNEGRM